MLSTPHLGEDTEAREASTRTKGGGRRFSISGVGRRLSGCERVFLLKPSHHHQQHGGGGGFGDGTGSRAWVSEWGAAIEGLHRMRSRPESRDAACQAALLMEDERVLRDDDGERVLIEEATEDDGERVLIEEATEDDGERVLMEDEGEQGQFSAAAAGTQNDTGEDAGVWLESERVAAERESALERERERETEETEIRFLYSQMDAIQRKLDWVTRERQVAKERLGDAPAEAGQQA